MFWDRIFDWCQDGNGNYYVDLDDFTVYRSSPIEIIVVDRVFGLLTKTHWSTISRLLMLVPFCNGPVGQYILARIARWN